MAMVEPELAFFQVPFKGLFGNAVELRQPNHAQTALAAGGFNFPAPVKFGMRLVAKVMTKSTYRF